MHEYNILGISFWCAGKTIEETTSRKVVANKAAQGLPVDAALGSHDSAASTANGQPPAPVPAVSATQIDDDILVDEDDLLTLVKQGDEQMRMHAMTPWMRMHSEQYSSQFNKSLAQCNKVWTSLVPGFNSVVQRVWDGERNVQSLQEAATAHLPADVHVALKGIAESVVQQLVQCTLALEQAQGEPKEGRPVTRALLVRAVKPVACCEDWHERHKQLLRRELDSDR